MILRSHVFLPDHWLDNFINAVIGHGCAQILVPLDYPSFFISRFFRMAESLEKHSGISCWLNLAHQTQRWLPYAQVRMQPFDARLESFLASLIIHLFASSHLCFV